MIAAASFSRHLEAGDSRDTLRVPKPSVVGGYGIGTAALRQGIGSGIPSGNAQADELMQTTPSPSPGVADSNNHTSNIIKRSRGAFQEVVVLEVLAQR